MFTLSALFFSADCSVAVQVPLAAFVADVLKPFDTAVKEKGLALCVVYDSEVRVCMCVCVSFFLVPLLAV